MDSNKFTFDTKYLEYWNDLQDSDNIRKTEVPSDEIAAHYISLMNIKKANLVLDLGCSFGRLYPIIVNYSEKIYGIDVHLEAIDQAKQYNYLALVKGTAEDTNFASEFFDKIICWAVYDVVNQNESLVEGNRVLKKGGQLLLTGKNIKYKVGDNNAFIAERNAKLKSFPNHFTDVYKLIDNIDLFGFKVLHAFGFEERGHFAKNISFEIDMKRNAEFYEYVLILEKVADVSDGCEKIEFSDVYSDVVKLLSKNHNYNNLIDFLNFHKNNIGG